MRSCLPLPRVSRKCKIRIKNFKSFLTGILSFQYSEKQSFQLRKDFSASNLSFQDSEDENVYRQKRSIQKRPRQKRPVKSAPDKSAPDKSAPDKSAPDKSAPDKSVQNTQQKRPNQRLQRIESNVSLPGVFELLVLLLDSLVQVHLDLGDLHLQSHHLGLLVLNRVLGLLQC